MRSDVMEARRPDGAAPGGSQARQAFVDAINTRGTVDLGDFIRDKRAGKCALVTSFGAESAVLVHMCSQVDDSFPIIFIDTEKHFSQTHEYRRALQKRLAMKGLRIVRPAPADTQTLDRRGRLWRDDPDRCCEIRKVRPLDQALSGFDSWLSGRKRFQGGLRTDLQLAELQDGQIKLNPLYDWTRHDIEAYFDRHDLPRHPLVDRGFPSIGCLNCTRPVADGDDLRAGRWSGADKTECGIHFTSSGEVAKTLPIAR